MNNNIVSKKIQLQDRAIRLYEQNLELSFKKVEDMIIDAMAHKKTKVLIYHNTEDYINLDIVDFDEFIERLRLNLSEGFEINHIIPFASTSYIEIKW